MVDVSSSPTGPEDPYKRLKVSGVEEKKYTEEFEQNLQKKEKGKKDTFLSFLAKKFLSLFPRGSLQGALKALERELSELSKYFQELGEKDLSQDVKYLKNLSYCWREFLNHFIPVALNKHPVVLQIRSFFDELHAFPDSQHFSLGYYLSEYAGEKWIPFPYMEMLRKLHEDYQSNIDSSHLNKWIKDISDITKFK